MLARYSFELANAFAARRDLLREQGRLLPGAAEAVAEMAVRHGVVQTVLTGTIKPNAIEKLRAFGLEQFFDVEIGGYGSQVYPKGAQLMMARSRAADKYGTRFDEELTVYIADSTRDVAAAQTGGARCLAVASGRSTVSELRKAGADVVFDDLSDTSAVVRAVDRLTLAAAGRAPLQRLRLVQAAGERSATPRHRVAACPSRPLASRSPPERHSSALSTIAREWGRIGCIGFGGPPAHIAPPRTLRVQDRHWLPPGDFEDGLAACNLLPGPASTQLAIFCAWRLRGPAGAILGGVCFIVPGLVIILGLAALFLAPRPPGWIAGAAAGAGAAVPAVAAGRRGGPDPGELAAGRRIPG